MPILCLTISFLIFLLLPEILSIAKGGEVILPIFSEISPEGRIGIFLSVAMIFILLKQNQINKSFLIFEQKRELRLQKREHDLLIYGSSINLLLTSLLNVNNILPRSDQKIDIHEHYFKDQDFFLNILKRDINHYFKRYVITKILTME